MQAKSMYYMVIIH